ncbi:hypothetical protein I3V59_08055 [Staphylococcus epidermidis]|uniref:hypothetical protein n=1 Tax=Staphylococcus epidermidis TaxID=1282 RepID=UPI0018B05B46|nr:hypothetical protein [Staphylococcus epidermidis]MBF9306738.1 hypothetical protein [Staphylococcus epidermidis]
MNQILDNIYSYNRKLFRNIPLSSILFGLITILIFTKPQLIGEININNYISSGVQKILNHLANTIYNPIFLLIIFITICFIASILDEIGHKLPTFKKKKLTFNNMGKITKIKSYNPYTLFFKISSIFKYIFTTLFKIYFIIKTIIEKNDFTNLFNLSTSSLFKVNFEIYMIRIIFLINVFILFIEIIKAFSSIEYSKLNDKGEFYIQEENISSYAEEICKKVINIDDEIRVPFYLLKLKDFDPTVYYITYKIKYRHIIVLKSDNIEEVKLAFENIENTDKFIKLKNDIIRNQLI